MPFTANSVGATGFSLDPGRDYYVTFTAPLKERVEQRHIEGIWDGMRGSGRHVLTGPRCRSSANDSPMSFVCRDVAA